MLNKRIPGSRIMHNIQDRRVTINIKETLGFKLLKQQQKSNSCNPRLAINYHSKLYVF